MEHLWAPWRSAYITATVREPGCIFCNALAGNDDPKSLIVLRAQYNFVILNRYPYTSGHIMIAPNVHVSLLNDVEEAASVELMALMRRSETVLRDVYKPDGLNIGMNLGEAAGAGIEQHIHMHMLPRWRGDANFMTTIADVRVIPEALEDTYRKLKAAFRHEAA